MIFQRLRPLCIKVLRTPCKRTIKELHISVSEFSTVDPKLLEYVVFPLRVALKQQNTDPVLVEHLLSCMADIVSKSTITSRDLFEELFRLSCALLDEKLIGQEFGNKLSYSEDIIFVTLKMLLAILQNTLDDLKINLLSGGQQLHIVGHCVSVLLTIVKHQTSRDVQLTAMNCLTALSGIHTTIFLLPSTITVDGNISWVKDITAIGSGLTGASGTFSSFLPGVVLSLCELVTKSSRAGQKVVSCGLLAWVHFVSLVMNDNEFDMSTAAVSNEDDNVPTGECERKLEVKRDQKWWKETSQKLDILITRMYHLISHPSWQVRWTLCVWSYCLLVNCPTTLSLSTPKCIEILVTLQSDSVLVVSSASTMLLQIFSDRFAASNSKKLISLFEENIFDLCSRLSKTLLSCGDEQKLCTLNLLLGYVKLLGPYVNGLAYSVSHIKALCSGFVKCLQLELNDIRIMEEQQVGEPQDGLLAWTLPLQFVNFQNDEVFHCIEKICLYIGHHIQLEPVIDQLMDMFRSSEFDRKEAILVIKSILVGAAEALSPMVLDKHNLLLQQVKELVFEFISPTYWRCKTSSSSDEGPGSQQDTVLSFRQLNSNILLVCLLIQSIGTFTQVVGGAFEPLLQTAIYPLLEKLGDRNAMISHCAHHSLSLIAHHCGYTSIANLITANADYLVNAVSLNLRCIVVHPEAPLVLKAVLLYGTGDVLPLMQDSIDEVMFALDVHQEKEHAFWPVLLALVKAVVKWFPNRDHQSVCVPQQVPTVHSDENYHRISHDKVKEFFMNYHQQKHRQCLQEDDDVDDVIEDNRSGMDNETESKKKTLSTQHQAALEVLKRCTYFVATSVLRTKLIVLDAIVFGLRALQDVQDELLPQVHKLWPAFTRRFGESNSLVALKATEVLVTMADICRDFLRRRVSKEVWPLLMSKLEQLASTSRTAGTNYRHTSNYKLQKMVLENAAVLAAKLEMSTEDYEKLAHACIPYLDCHQPLELQTKCIMCLETLAACHADLLWLLLQQIQSNHILQPPHVSLKPYRFPPHQTAVDYQNNVKLLIELIK